MRDAKVLQIVEGTSEIQRHVIVQYLRRRLTPILRARDFALPAGATLTPSCALKRHPFAPGRRPPLRAPDRPLGAGLACAARPSSWRSIGLAFAGSAARIADGVAIAGVDVGGLTPEEAQTLLEQRFDRVARVPVVFTAGGGTSRSRPTTLGVEADWAAAIETAAREGDGFGPVRGFRRLQTRFFGADISPPAQAYGAALDFKLGRSRGGDRPAPRRGELVRRGLAIVVVPGQAGRVLDQKAAARDRPRARAPRPRPPVALPVRIDPSSVTAADLAPPPARRGSRSRRRCGSSTRHALEAAALADRRAARRCRSAARRRLAIGGPGRRRGSRKLRKTIERAPVDATLRRLAGRASASSRPSPVSASTCRRPQGAARRRHLADRPDGRARGRARRRRSAPTADAQAMGITGVVGATTRPTAASEPDPQRPARRAADRRRADRSGQDVLVQRDDGRAHGREGLPGGAGDHQRRAPDRPRRRRLPGLDDRLQRRLRGRAEIDERTNHALYITTTRRAATRRSTTPTSTSSSSNDTANWMLLRTFVGSGSLTVNLYGTPQNRRVERPAPLASSARRRSTGARPRRC